MGHRTKRGTLTMVIQDFSQIHEARHAIANQIIDTTKTRIDARQAGPRTSETMRCYPVLTTELFSPSAIAILRWPGTFSRSVTPTPCSTSLPITARFKGSITFNLGIAYLRSYDFTAAMHYFELAEEETH